MWKVIIYPGKGWFQNGIFFTYLKEPFNLRVNWMWIYWHPLMYQSISVLLWQLGESIIPGSLEVEGFQPSIDISSELCIFSFIISPHSSIKCPGKHIRGQFKLLIVVTLNWVEASWPTTVLNILENVPHEVFHFKNLISNVFGDWLLKGMPSLHLTLWLLRDMCCVDNASHPQSVLVVVGVS